MIYLKNSETFATVAGDFLYSFLEMIDNYFDEFRISQRSILYLSGLPLFAFFIFRSDTIAQENIAFNTVMHGWVVLLNFMIFLFFFSAALDNKNFYDSLRKIYCFGRSQVFSASVVVSAYLLATGLLTGSQINVGKIGAALLLQIIFIPFFAKLPTREDAESMRYSTKYEFSPVKKILYKIWSRMVLLLLLPMSLVCINDLMTLPIFRIS